MKAVDLVYDRVWSHDPNEDFSPSHVRDCFTALADAIEAGECEEIVEAGAKAAWAFRRQEADGSDIKLEAWDDMFPAMRDQIMREYRLSLAAALRAGVK